MKCTCLSKSIAFPELPGNRIQFYKIWFLSVRLVHHALSSTTTIYHAQYTYYAVPTDLSDSEKMFHDRQKFPPVPSARPFQTKACLSPPFPLSMVLLAFHWFQTKTVARYNINALYCIRSQQVAGIRDRDLEKHAVCLRG